LAVDFQEKDLQLEVAVEVLHQVAVHP
jgi:hypothetical protein